jgi:hypothetical protein
MPFSKMGRENINFNNYNKWASYEIEISPIASSSMLGATLTRHCTISDNGSAHNSGCSVGYASDDESENCC